VTYDDKLPDRKNRRVFRHAKMEPEVPRHRRKWPTGSCKRNKGLPHQWVNDDRDYPSWFGNREWHDSYTYRRALVETDGGMRSETQKALVGQRRTVFKKCIKCDKRHQEDEWRNVVESKDWKKVVR